MIIAKQLSGPGTQDNFVDAIARKIVSPDDFSESSPCLCALAGLPDEIGGDRQNLFKAYSALRLNKTKLFFRSRAPRGF